MNFKQSSERYSRIQSLMLMLPIIKPMIMATKERSTNIKADQAFQIAVWMNRRLVNRGCNDSSILALPSHILEKELNMTERQVRNAKALLRDLGIITFYKVIIAENGKSFANLWALSILYTRVAVTTRGESKKGYGQYDPRPIAESRQGKAIDPEAVRFKLMSKKNVKFDYSDGSDTVQYAKYRNVYTRELEYARDSFNGAKKTALANIINRRRLKGQSVDMFDHNFSNVEFYEW